MASRRKNPAPSHKAATMAETHHPRKLLVGGQWAAQQFLAAMESGATQLSSSQLRSLDTLRKNEWEFLDDQVLEEAIVRLRGIAAIRSMGLVIPVPNALGRMMFQWEDVNDLNAAEVSLSGISQTEDDALDFQLSQVPLAITHKDFRLNIRHLMASRNPPGEPLDTAMARMSGRLVAEKLESMLFVGGPVFGGAQIYGITNHPNVNHVQFQGGGELWDASGHNGEDILFDVLAMIAKLHTARMFGPYALFVPSTFGPKLEDDFKANSDISIRERLEQIDMLGSSKGGGGIIVADQMKANTVALVQMTRDVVALAEGEPIQTVQWDAMGGFIINMKVWTIAVPVVRATQADRSGICIADANA